MRTIMCVAKKTLCIFAAIILSFSLAACDNSGQSNNMDSNTKTESESKSPSGQLPGETTTEYDGLFPQHEPMGTGMGAMPGRVVWVYEPECVDWTSGVWSRIENFDYDLILSMVRDGITSLAGADNTADAWETLFTYHNNTRGKGRVNYTPGEKIAIKVNMNGAGWGGDNTENTTNVFTNPVVLRALLVSMVEDAGVLPDDITVYDASRNIPQFMQDYCGHGVTQGVHFAGREECEKDENYPIDWNGNVNGETTYLPTVVTESEYLINLADLKGHSMNGITLTAKNHFGSFINQKSDRDAMIAGLHPFVSANDMGVYTPLVDLTGHYMLGQKTVLYMLDGIIVSPGEGSTTSVDGDNTKWQQEPFNGGYTASLFFSQDPVAIDSVGADFLGNEPTLQKYNSVIRDNPNVENYLHEESGVANAPSGTVYYDGNGNVLTNLGVHEHWNNCTDKQYSRNLGKSEGIELVRLGSGMEETIAENTAQLTLDDKRYEVTFEDNPTAQEIYNMLPLELTLTPYSNLEYSAALPETPVYEGSPTSSKAKYGTINYCKEYNSFVIVCQNHDDPFMEVKIADITGDISWMTTAGESISAVVNKN